MTGYVNQGGEMQVLSRELDALNPSEFAVDGVGHDKGLMFKSFQKDYTFTTDLDVQEAADAHLILICRFLMYLDDTQYKHLKNALDLRNGCGHPTGYQPDPDEKVTYSAAANSRHRRQLVAGVRSDTIRAATCSR